MLAFHINLTNKLSWLIMARLFGRWLIYGAILYTYC